jgi:hypothetical protein
MNLRLVIFMSLILISFRGLASQPPNPIQVTPHSRYDNGYQESRFNEVIMTLKAVYGPIIQQLGGELVVLDDWSDGAVNMWAWRVGAEYVLEIPGGFSRFYLINEAAFLLTICHELGHLLGGDPAQDQISYEGQSDYFSAKDCPRELFMAFDQVVRPELPAEVRDLCQNESERRELCHQVLVGGLSATAYYAELEGAPAPLFSTPSPEKVKKTISTHPSAQCRLDTILQGYFRQPRPSCWF